MPDPPPLPPFPLTVADTDGPDHDAAQRGDGSNGNASSDQHHHPVVEADALGAAELSPAGRGQGRGLVARTRAQRCPRTLGLLRVDLHPWCQDWFTPGSKEKLQDKEGGQHPGYGDPQPRCVSQRWSSPLGPEVEERLKTNQSWFPATSPALNQGYLLLVPQVMCLELPLGRFPPQGRLRAGVQVLDRHHSQPVGHLVREAHGAVDKRAAVLRGERQAHRPLSRGQPGHQPGGCRQREPCALLWAEPRLQQGPGREPRCPRSRSTAPSQGSLTPIPCQRPPQPCGDTLVHPAGRSRRTVLVPMRSAVMEREVTRMVAEPAPSSTAAP